MKTIIYRITQNIPPTILQVKSCVGAQKQLDGRSYKNTHRGYRKINPGLPD